MSFSDIMHDVYDSLRHVGFMVCPKFTLKLEFYRHLGYRLNLKNPSTLNEKLQWLKLYDRNPGYTKMADKYDVRKYIADTIGEEYLIPIYGVWESFEDIDFNKLPKQFVLKCTHDSGGIVICTDKGSMDFKAARKKINRCLKRNYYNSSCEYPYKNIKPRIIGEKYIKDEEGGIIKDYKFLCFNGLPRVLYVVTDRGIDNRVDFFDLEFKHLPVRQIEKNANKIIEKPQRFEEMVKFSGILSRGIPQLRVDLFNINGNIYFGELTLYHSGGFEKFEPFEYDKLFGSWLKLPEDNSQTETGERRVKIHGSNRCKL